MTDMLLTFALAGCCVALGFLLRGKQQHLHSWERLSWERLWVRLNEMENNMNEALAAVTSKLEAAVEVQGEILTAIEKVGLETEALVNEVAALKAVIAGMESGAPPELVAAAEAVSTRTDALKVALQVVDDKVPDPVEPPPVEPPPAV